MNRQIDGQTDRQTDRHSVSDAVRDRWINRLEKFMFHWPNHKVKGNCVIRLIDKKIQIIAAQVRILTF